MKLVSADSGGRIAVWDLSKRTLVHSLYGHKRAVISMVATHDYIISGSNDGTARIWNINSGSCISTLQHYGAVTGLHIYNNRTPYSTAQNCPKIFLWDIGSGVLIAKHSIGTNSCHFKA